MKLKAESPTLNGFLDKGSFFHGELVFEETFRIDGRFEGKVQSGAELILGDSAEVVGEIDVARLSVNGSLKGTVRARERVELHAQARVAADLTTPVLKIEEGAIFEGTCKMGDRPAGNVVGIQPSRH
jgi:cytoskeletal protein CcmA (bactofilin family)